MKIAIMQPYFFPYAGYFRLIRNTDLFVILDCVQFPRRGWVHRNRIEIAKEQFKWLTLPLQKQQQSCLIQSLTFSTNAQQQWQQRLLKYQKQLNEKHNPELYDNLLTLQNTPIETLITGLKLVCKQLSLSSNFVRSSELSISAEFKGQQRIIEVCKKLKADQYLNASGGSNLYTENEFNKNNIELQFLKEYKGSYQSILQRLFNEDLGGISAEFNEN